MSGRRPDGRGAFLGTQEIVQRLRATRPAHFGAVKRPVGGALLVAAVCLVWGQLARQRFVGRHTTVQAENAVAVGSAAPVPASHQTPAATLSGADGRGHHGEAPGGEAGHVRLRVVVRGAPPGAQLRIDGEPVGAVHRWEGTLPRGPHAVSVRAKTGEQSYVVQLQSAQEVVFELPRRRVHARSMHERAPRDR